MTISVENNWLHLGCSQKEEERMCLKIWSAENRTADEMGCSCSVSCILLYYNLFGFCYLKVWWHNATLFVYFSYFIT